MRKIWFFSLLAISTSLIAQQRDIEVEDFTASPVFYPKTLSGFVNLNDGKTYCVHGSDEVGNSVIEQFEYASGEKIGMILNGADLAKVKGENSFSFSAFQFDKAQQKILFTYSIEMIYRHSSRAYFGVYDIVSKKVDFFEKQGKCRYPVLDPGGTMVAYVKDNNLFILDLAKGKHRQITKDGKQNEIINGAVDWVYEEEFSMSRGFEWNIDGSKIAYYRFDESAVKEWVMPLYGSLYPEQYRFKYPKAGEENSIVDIYVCDASKGKSKKLELGSENDQYLPRIQWTKKPSLLAIQRLNRLQNYWEMLLADIEAGTINVSLKEENKYYIDIRDDIYFMEDGRHMVVKSEINGYNHLYFHKVEGPQVFPITKGDWEVDKVLGIDAKNEVIYYTSTEVSPVERHIYSISIDGKNKKQLTKEAGTHQAFFSHDFSRALHRYGTTEGSYIYTIRSAEWESIKILEDNAEFKEGLKEFKLSPINFSSLTTERGDELNYWIITPQKMDSGKTYPLLMYVYGGPGSQLVTKDFMYGNYFYHQMLANKYGIVVACVDNRGTGGRGEEFKKMTYKQLGVLETEDQISAAKYFAAMDFIDAGRIAIWGWSYGGYMSSMCLAQGSDVFKIAVAVAPVSDWKFYDNIYTERFMQRPADNPSGYEKSAVLNKVKNIKGSFLIIHGTGDDNVHFQNSVEMVDALIRENIPFDSEYYPNRNHGIYGGKTRWHLYNKMTNFIVENL